MQILSMEAHYDKRPMNALLAKAVEVCSERGMSWLVYGKYVYGNKQQSTIGEFKRRNGFRQVNYRRYFVPLTWRGRVAMRLRLHRGLLGLLPERAIQVLLAGRARALAWRSGHGERRERLSEVGAGARHERSESSSE